MHHQQYEDDDIGHNHNNNEMEEDIKCKRNTSRKNVTIESKIKVNSTLKMIMTTITTAT